MEKDFQVLENIIHTTTVRHKVLANNIANVDTPGYKAKDVSFNNVLQGQVMSLKRTAPNHLTGGPGTIGKGEIKTEERAPWEDGNNVTLDMELANMTENALLYQTGITLLTKKLQMYKSAIKGQ